VSLSVGLEEAGARQSEVSKRPERDRVRSQRAGSEGEGPEGAGAIRRGSGLTGARCEGPGGAVARL